MLLRSFVLLVVLLAVAVGAFSKNSLSKDKNTRSYSKHPISKRVLRFERSVTLDDLVSGNAEFPKPDELSYFNIDFAKIRPEIPSKTKTSSYGSLDYAPELEF
ncbi:unnamed protein product [Caenorhabditis auriculariae]|uniref:Uncharacterized protein n=1 Tax=Caenorhabditis auriculariae TaxID=2777116 RepID=A0A8S1HIJ3_9PELO|nr:unnamed protein product [Caenorhabditis auriculariae]